MCVYFGIHLKRVIIVDLGDMSHMCNSAHTFSLKFELLDQGFVQILWQVRLLIS